MRVVIVGGGFAGVHLAKSLAKQDAFEVVLVDKNNYHFFPPLIYQVATSFIEPSNISYPFRKMFQGKKNIRFVYGELQSVDTLQQTITTTAGALSYDKLVLAMGTETNYFGMKGVKQQAMPLKDIDDALHLRNHLLDNMEKASRESDPMKRQSLMQVVIAGGGPTGVEVAGMLAEMGKTILRKDYPELHKEETAIYLIDAAKSLVGPMSVKAQQEVHAQLTDLGVHIKLETAVKDYKEHVVYLSNGETIPTQTLIWASGVVAREVKGLPVESIGRAKRILVDEYNAVLHVNHVYAIGDMCLQTSDKNNPNGHPQLAQVAIQQGLLLARNMKAIQEGKALKAFAYKNKGSMAIISKYKAVVDLPYGFFKGFLAWLTWLLIHILPIADFRNRLKIIHNWFWSFITNDPTLRLIIRPSGNKNEDGGAKRSPTDKFEVR